MKKNVFTLLPVFAGVLISCGGTASSTEVNNSNFAFALSTHRMAEVDFDINLDELIESANPQTPLQKQPNGPLRQTQSPGTVDIDTEEGQLTYTDLPSSSNVGLEFRNLNNNIQSVAESAKNQVDWALENITLVDRWVIMSSDQYLLQYDATTDVVSLWIANQTFTSEDNSTYALKRITVQYTENGELLVEVNDAYKSNNFASFGRLRFIKGSLYEWSSDIWANGVREEVPTMGGPGWFKAVKDPITNLWMYWRSTYFNAGLNIQTPNGWVQTYVRIAPEDSNPSDDLATFDRVKVSSGALENDVLAFYLNETSSTNLTFYPTAFTGWSSIQAQIADTTMTNLQNWNDINQDLPLYETNAGSLMLNNNVSTEGISTIVRAHNIDDNLGVGYVGYVAESAIIINQNYRNMLSDLLSQFSTLGLAYAHGNLAELFDEVIAITNNLDRLFNQFLLNDVSGFSTLTTLRDVVNLEMEMIASLPTAFALKIEAFTSIDVSDLPPVVIGANDLLSLNNAITGTVTLNADGSFSTGNLSINIPRTVLLTSGANYALTYAWYADGFFIPIGQENTVAYEGGALAIEGNQTFDLQPGIAGNYELVVYLLKVLDDNTSLRVSSVSYVTVETFDELVTIGDVVNGNQPTYTFIENQNRLTLTVSLVDIEAPSLIYLPLNLSYQGTSSSNQLTLVLPENMSLIAMVENFDIVDNVDQNILFSFALLTWSEGDITSLTEVVELGTYTYTFADQAGNSTSLSITFNPA